MKKLGWIISPLMSTSTISLLIIVGCGRAQFQVVPTETGLVNPRLTPCQELAAGQCTETETQYDLREPFTATAPLTKTDILFVIDNSGSMEIEQQNIGSSFNQFINLLDSTSAGQLDYRIAIVTTDMTGDLSNPSLMKGGRLVPFKNVSSSGTTLFLDRSIPNRVASFYETVQINKDLNPAWECGNPSAPRYYCPSGDERGTYAAIAAVNRNESNWMRTDATLAIVVLSDEDVRSTGGRNMPGYPSYVPAVLEIGKDRAEDVEAAVKNKFGTAKKMNGHGLIVKPGDSNCMAMQATQSYPGHEGTIYSALSGLTGGIVGSVCQTPYDQQVSAIGQVIQTTLNSFQLKCIPINGYVQVEFTNRQLSNSYRLNSSQLSFTPSLPSGTEFVVRYSCPKTS